MKPTLAAALGDYGVAYRAMRAARVGRCKTQDEETAPCWTAGGEPDEDWCETCARRPAYVTARRHAGVKLRRLRRLLAKERSL